MRLFDLFKKKPAEPPYNIYHPDVADKIELAFEVGSTFNKQQYYRFKAPDGETAEFKMPTGRYKWYDALFHESELRMRLSTLNAYLDELEQHLDGSKGQIQLGKAFQVLYSMRSRTRLAFEPETIKRLASIAYFDASEDLRDFDEEYGRKKVAFWEKNDFYGFFLTRPIDELCNLKGISETYLKTYLQAAETILKDLTYVPGKASLENSSKNKSTI